MSAPIIVSARKLHFVVSSRWTFVACTFFHYKPCSLERPTQSKADFRYICNVFSIVLVTLSFFLLEFSDFCKSLRRFLNRIGLLWSFFRSFGATAVCAQSCSVLGTFEASPRPRPFWGKTGLFSTIRGLSRAKAVPGPAAPALQERFLNMRRLCADSCPTTTARGCFFHIFLENTEKYSLQNWYAPRYAPYIYIYIYIYMRFQDHFSWYAPSYAPYIYTYIYIYIYTAHTAGARSLF